MLSFKLLVGKENETRSPILKKICDHRGLFLFLRSLAHQDLLLLTLSGIRPGSQLAVLDFLHPGLFADLCRSLQSVLCTRSRTMMDSSKFASQDLTRRRKFPIFTKSRATGHFFAFARLWKVVCTESHKIVQTGVAKSLQFAW